MLLIFGECNIKGMHVKLLLCVPQGNHRDITRVQQCFISEKNLTNYGEFEKQKRIKLHLTTTVGNILTVLAHLEENPHTFIYAVAIETDFT